MPPEPERLLLRPSTGSPHAKRRELALPRPFRVLQLRFQPLYDDEPSGMLTLLVVVDPLHGHVRWVEPMRCPLEDARALRRIYERACLAPLQGRPGIPLGLTTPDRTIALGLGEALPELAVSLDDGALPERLAIEAAFLALAAL